jgi:hypothetical protein
LSEVDVVGDSVQLGAGVIRLSAVPDLGATVDRDALERYRVDR